MAQEYTIKAVSSAPPREWSGKFGLNKSYRVRFAGSDMTVELAKLASSPPPQVGEIVFGTIESNEYGLKFKTASKVGGGFGGQNRPLRDDSAIQAQWAIGQAMSWFGGDPASRLDKDDTPPFDKVEALANDLFAMIDRVKGSKPVFDVFDKDLFHKNEVQTSTQPVPRAVPLEGEPF